jgi:3-hydroxybutyrate dehydrogenase
MIAMTLETFGRLDVLVNNASIQPIAPLEQFTARKWEALLAANLSSAFHTARLALPAMRRNGFGRIINIASVDGLVAPSLNSASAAMVQALVGLTKAAAREITEANITCNMICPGETSKFSAEKIGAASAFLASETAGSITGMALPLGGGFGAQ